MPSMWRRISFGSHARTFPRRRETGRRAGSPMMHHTEPSYRSPAWHVVASSNLALVVSKRVIRPYVKPLRLKELLLPLRLSGYRLTQVWAQRSDDDDGHRWLRRVLTKIARDRDS